MLRHNNMLELTNIRLAPEGTYLTWSDGKILVCHPNDIEITLPSRETVNLDNLIHKLNKVEIL